MLQMRLRGFLDVGKQMERAVKRKDNLIKAFREEFLKIKKQQDVQKESDQIKIISGAKIQHEDKIKARLQLHATRFDYKKEILEKIEERDKEND